MDEQQIDLEEEQQATLDGQVLAVMNYPEPSDRPWSVDELARVIKKDPHESLARLEREGLVHATRQALLAHPCRSARRGNQAVAKSSRAQCALDMLRLETSASTRNLIRSKFFPIKRMKP